MHVIFSDLSVFYVDLEQEKYNNLSIKYSLNSQQIFKNTKHILKHKNKAISKQLPTLMLDANVIE